METFTQQYIMVVFGVKYRLGLIDPKWAHRLYALIGKILTNIEGVTPIRINGYIDHVHVLYSTRGLIADAEITRKIKAESSRWLNEQHWTQGQFGWQNGSGRFSCSPSNLGRLCNYIDSQWDHHKRVSFREEYQKWLESLGTQYNQYHLPQLLI